MGYAIQVCAFFYKCWSVIKKIWKVLVKFAEVVQILKELISTVKEKRNAIAVAVKDGNNILETVIQNGEMKTDTSVVVQADQIAADVDNEIVL